MNNYTNEKERRLYFDDLWVRLKRSWVLVLAITLVFGILVDLLGYMRSKNGNDLHIEQTAEELRAQLTQDELQDVESARPRRIWMIPSWSIWTPCPSPRRS